MTSCWADRTWRSALPSAKPSGCARETRLRDHHLPPRAVAGGTSRKPDGQYGESLRRIWAAGTSPSTRWRPTAPDTNSSTLSGGFDALPGRRCCRTRGPRSIRSRRPLRLLRVARSRPSWWGWGGGGGFFWGGGGFGSLSAPEVRAAMTEQAGRLEIVSTETDHQRADQADA